MKMLRMILLICGSFGWQVPAHAENAFLWKALQYHATRNGYPMPKRILPAGSLVKVVAIHGAKADIVTPSGDNVTVSRADLHMVDEAPALVPIALQTPAVATSTPPNSSPSPNQVGAGPARSSAATPPPSQSPSPNQAGGGGGTGPARPGETGKQPVPVRCSHITKNGEQCSRMTTSPNGLCWQHGGN